MIKFAIAIAVIIILIALYVYSLTKYDTNYVHFRKAGTIHQPRYNLGIKDGGYYNIIVPPWKKLVIEDASFGRKMITDEIQKEAAGKLIYTVKSNNRFGEVDQSKLLRMVYWFQ
jgi:hypothetical protein